MLFLLIHAIFWRIGLFDTNLQLPKLQKEILMKLDHSP